MTALAVEPPADAPPDSTWFTVHGATGLDAVAGMATLPDRDADERYVHSVWVAPERRGQKLASGLLHSVAIAARAQGATRLMLWVFCENTTAAGVFRHLGFYPVGPVHQYQDGRLEQRYCCDLGDLTVL